MVPLFVDVGLVLGWAEAGERGGRRGSGSCVSASSIKGGGGRRRVVGRRRVEWEWDRQRLEAGWGKELGGVIWRFCVV